MFKKTFFQVHWFLGITAGLILSIMGVTGAIYSYEQQILKWINQDSYVVQAEQRDKLTPAELYQHFHQQSPDLKLTVLQSTLIQLLLLQSISRKKESAAVIT